MSLAACRTGWLALVVTMTARLLLGVLASLLLWATLPALFGWSPTVVMTGSMAPTLAPGDVVVSRPVEPGRTHLGQTLLFPDPDHAGHLRLHRWVDVAADGTMITKGDANVDRDSSTVAPADVDAVAVLRVPLLAQPVLWARDGRLPPLLLTALAVTAAVAGACWFRPAPEPDVDPRPGDDTPAGEDGDGSHVPPSRLLPGRALVAAAAVAAVTVALAPAAEAAPLYGGRTTNAADAWNAATYFTCVTAVRAAGAYFSWPLSETSGQDALDVTGNNRVGDYDGGYTRGVAGPCASDGRTGVTLNGLTGRIDHGSASLASGAAVTLQVWFRTTTARGGVLFSVSQGAALRMAIAMPTTGTLVLAALVGGTTRQVTPTTKWNDGAWHLATGTLGAAGMTLYVDGRAVGTNAAATSAASVTGDPRVGYGDADDLSAGTHDYFQGTVGFGTLFTRALTAAEVNSQYGAGKAAN